MSRPVRLGLAANLGQFALLVVVNGFVGAMVGLERSILPALAEREFRLAAHAAVLSFIVVFGVVKAATNYFAGHLSDRIGRKPLLVGGWLIAAPVPFLLMWAPSWGWILFANVLLGASQGLTWSTTVIMKIDLAGPERRGLAMGLNECAGYLAVGASALATGYLAAEYGLRPQPFYLGVGFVALGLLLSVLAVRETHGHAHHEAKTGATDSPAGLGAAEVFARTSWRDRDLSAVSQAGLVNNLNDGMAWGLFPLLFASAGLGLPQIGVLAAVYPAVWGVGQLVTGALSDRVGRKWLIAAGLWVQAAGIALVAVTSSYALFALGAVLLGAGTAMVYPTLLAAIGDVAHPSWRASAVGVYRLWRDLGYAIGALVAGVTADQLGVRPAVMLVAGITATSGAVVAWRLSETLPARLHRRARHHGGRAGRRGATQHARPAHGVDGRGRQGPHVLSAAMKKSLAVVALACCASATAPAEERPSLTLGLRLQGWYVADQAGAADGSASHDFLLRRGYLSATGKLNSSVAAFVHVAGDRIGQSGLDNPGLGLGTGIALRDAWIAWQPAAAFRVQAGRMYVPFTRAFGTESTFTQLGVDLPQSQGGGRGALFYPSKVGRDDGLVVWGVPWHGRLQYRLAVMEGVEGDANPGDALRLAGRLSLSLLDAETAWFNRGTYLGEKRVLAIGLGFDRQGGLAIGGIPDRTYEAWTADAFLDLPLGNGALTVEVSYTDAQDLPQGLAFAGVPAGGDARMAYVQAGYLLPWPIGPGRVQLYGRAERVLVKGGEDAALPSGGVSYLVRGHDLKLTADWSRSTRGARPASSALTVQAQVGF